MSILVDFFLPSLCKHSFHDHLFGFPIFRFLAYLIKDVPETRRANSIWYLRFYFISGRYLFFYFLFSSMWQCIRRPSGATDCKWTLKNVDSPVVVWYVTFKNCVSGFWLKSQSKPYTVLRRLWGVYGWRRLLQYGAANGLYPQMLSHFVPNQKAFLSLAFVQILVKHCWRLLLIFNSEQSLAKAI